MLDERKHCHLVSADPVFGQVTSGNRIHSPDEFLQSLRPEERHEHSLQPLGIVSSGIKQSSSEELSDRAGPCADYQFVLVGEQQAVSFGSVKYNGWFAVNGSCEQTSIFQCSIVIKFTEVGLPKKSQKLKYFTDEIPCEGSRWDSWRSPSVLVDHSVVKFG